MSESFDFTEHPEYEAPFWDGARQGKLLIQECKDCGKRQFYPRLVCRHCQSRNLTWIESAGRGSIHSYTVVHRAPTEWQHLTPYAMIVVDLDEGARITSRIVVSPLASVAIGARVAARFEEVMPGVTMPVFAVTATEAAANAGPAAA